MKVKAETLTEFKPIKVELVIETKDELLDLWHRLNMSVACVQENSRRDSYHPYPENWCGVDHDFFEIINFYCRRVWFGE